MSEGFWLEIEEDGQARRVRLTGSETAIGRDADNTVVVRDRRSSRHHCRLIVGPQGLVLEDLGSRNGTVLKGTTVTRSAVQSGDEFWIGKTRFTVRQGAIPEGDDEDHAAADGPDPSVRRSAAELETLAAAEREDAADLDDAAPPLEPAVTAGARTSGASRAAKHEERESEPLGRRADSGKVVLACLAGSRKGETIEVTELPFGIGRRSRNALALRDGRASGEHARIVTEDGAYYVEDLGSRNGTYLNGRRIARGLLTPGSVLQIGSSRFRLEVPRSEALERALEARGSPSPGDAGGFDGELTEDPAAGRLALEALEGAARSEHPLAVLVIVLILGVICYFSVDVAQRVLIRPAVDPPDARNQLGDGWSFEALAAEGHEGAVPGWSVHAADRGRIGTGPEFAQYPGRQALHLAGEGGTGALTRAVFEHPFAVRAGAGYRLAGFVRNQGAFAAGLLVEWLREVDGEATVVERSFSETARENGEVLNVDQVVRAPGSVARARLSCFALGGTGRSAFDRVVFAPIGDGPEGEPPAEDAATERVYGFGLAEGEPANHAPLTLTIQPDGTMSLARGRRVVLPRLWLGLAPDADPGRFGSRLAPPRVLSEESGSLSFVVLLPDLLGETWITVEASLFVAAANLTLRLRSVSSPDRDEGAQAPDICLYFEPRDPATPLRFPGSGEEGTLAGVEIPRGAQGEIVLGEKGGQVVLGFSPGAHLTHVEHPYTRAPDGAARRVLVASGRGGELGLSISMTSRLERQALLRFVREAEEHYRAGRVGAAVALLEALPARFPEQSSEIELTRERSESWRLEGATALDELQRDLATLRASPGPVLYDVLRSRAADLESRFAGSTVATRAAQVAAEAREFREAEAARRRDEEIAAIYEQGRQYFLADRLALAKLYLARVVELAAGTSRARQAAITLESIEKRRAEHREALLR